MIQFLYSLLILLAAWLENEYKRRDYLRKAARYQQVVLATAGGPLSSPSRYLKKKKVGMKKRGPPSDSIRYYISFRVDGMVP